MFHEDTRSVREEEERALLQEELDSLCPDKERIQAHVRRFGPPDSKEHQRQFLALLLGVETQPEDLQPQDSKHGSGGDCPVDSTHRMLSRHVVESHNEPLRRTVDEIWREVLVSSADISSELCMLALDVAFEIIEYYDPKIQQSELERPDISTLATVLLHISKPFWFIAWNFCQGKETKQADFDQNASQDVLLSRLRKTKPWVLEMTRSLCHEFCILTQTKALFIVEPANHTISHKLEPKVCFDIRKVLLLKDPLIVKHMDSLHPNWWALCGHNSPETPPSTWIYLIYSCGAALIPAEITACIWIIILCQAPMILSNNFERSCLGKFRSLINEDDTLKDLVHLPTLDRHTIGVWHQRTCPQLFTMLLSAVSVIASRKHILQNTSELSLDDILYSPLKLTLGYPRQKMAEKDASECQIALWTWELCNVFIESLNSSCWNELQSTFWFSLPDNLSSTEAKIEERSLAKDQNLENILLDSGLKNDQIPGLNTLFYNMLGSTVHNLGCTSWEIAYKDTLTMFPGYTYDANQNLESFGSEKSAFELLKQAREFLIHAKENETHVEAIPTSQSHEQHACPDINQPSFMFSYWPSIKAIEALASCYCSAVSTNSTCGELDQPDEVSDLCRNAYASVAASGKIESTSIVVDIRLSSSKEGFRLPFAIEFEVDLDGMNLVGMAEEDTRSVQQNLHVLNREGNMKSTSTTFCIGEDADTSDSDSESCGERMMGTTRERRDDIPEQVRSWAHKIKEIQEHLFQSNGQVTGVAVVSDNVALCPTATTLNELLPNYTSQLLSMWLTLRALRDEGVREVSVVEGGIGMILGVLPLAFGPVYSRTRNTLLTGGSNGRKLCSLSVGMLPRGYDQVKQFDSVKQWRHDASVIARRCDKVIASSKHDRFKRLRGKLEDFTSALSDEKRKGYSENDGYSFFREAMERIMAGDGSHSDCTLLIRVLFHFCRGKSNSASAKALFDEIEFQQHKTDMLSGADLMRQVASEAGFVSDTQLDKPERKSRASEIFNGAKERFAKLRGEASRLVSTKMNEIQSSRSAALTAPKGDALKSTEYEGAWNDSASSTTQQSSSTLHVSLRKGAFFVDLKTSSQALLYQVGESQNIILKHHLRNLIDGITEPTQSISVFAAKDRSDESSRPDPLWILISEVELAVFSSPTQFENSWKQEVSKALTSSIKLLLKTPLSHLHELTYKKSNPSRVTLTYTTESSTEAAVTIDLINPSLFHEVLTSRMRRSKTRM